jgi:hypothetical protein
VSLFWSHSWLVIPCKALILVVSGEWDQCSLCSPFLVLNYDSSVTHSNSLVWVMGTKQPTLHMGSVQSVEVRSYQEMSKDMLWGIVVFIKLEQKMVPIGCFVLCRGQKWIRFLSSNCGLSYCFHFNNFRRYIHDNFPYFVNLENSIGWDGYCII